MLNMKNNNNNNVIKHDLNIIKAFSYFYDIVDAIASNTTLKINKIVSGGGRVSAKTYSAILLAMIIFLKDLNCQINFYRNYQKDIFKSIFTEFNNLLETIANPYDFKINLTRKFIKNKCCEINFKSLRQVQETNIVGKGVPNIKQKYILNIWEESWEMKESDILSEQTAQRGINLKQRFDIHNFNPDFLNKPIVKEIANALPEDDILLKTKGQQLKIVGNTLYHRTNRRVNPFYDPLTNPIEQAIKDMYRVNSELAKSWDLGKAGLGRKGMFSHILKYIMPIQDLFIVKKNVYEYFGGLDFGFKKDAFAFVFMGVNREVDEVIIIDEFYFENETLGYKHTHIANLLLDFIIDLDNKLNIKKQGNFYVKSDYSDYAFMEIMNGEATKRNLLWIIFEPCKKLPLEIRYGYLIELIASNCVYRVVNKTNMLYSELVSAKWKDNIATLKPLETQDHLLDALNYGLQPYLSTLKNKIEWNKQ